MKIQVNISLREKERTAAGVFFAHAAFTKQKLLSSSPSTETVYVGGSLKHL
jgi:hypothetical protein